MRICVAHETVYRYDAPCTGVIQTLRLTPRNHVGQYVVNWRIDISADCRLEPQEDAFGNIAHAFSVAGPICELRLLVEGEVETQDTAGVVRSAVERFPPSLFLRETAMTHADKAILAYAARFPRPTAANMLATLHNLMARLHEDIAFDAEATSAAPSAADAFMGGRGISQDLAQRRRATRWARPGPKFTSPTSAGSASIRRTACAPPASTCGLPSGSIISAPLRCAAPIMEAVAKTWRSGLRSPRLPGRRRNDPPDRHRTIKQGG